MCSTACKAANLRGCGFESHRSHHCPALCVGIGAPPLKRVDEGSIPSRATRKISGCSTKVVRLFAKEEKPDHYRSPRPISGLVDLRQYVNGRRIG